MLDNRLRSLNIPSSIENCNNVNCTQSSHHDDTDLFLVKILQSMKTTAKECLPYSMNKSQKSKKAPIANWREEIQPFKDKAMFWHSIWISAGRPLNTELHKIMKRTRNVCHLHIRKNKKLAENLKKDAFLEACIDNKCDIFELIRKERQTNTASSAVIDGCSNDIENKFADVYQCLYSSVDDENDLGIFKHHLKEKIVSSSQIDVEEITTDVVDIALKKLKNNKTDPVLDFNSDCMKNAPTIFSQYLASLFRSFVTHGHISSFLMISTLVPILKDKLGDITSSENYRSIALSSLILKVFDYVLLYMYDDKLTTDELQFGYQKNVSTSMCTWMVVETIDYFQRNDSNVYACVMDMTKAFDNVRHSTLFQKLEDRGIPAIFLRILVVMYEKQLANVRWNDKLSRCFSIKNGVKQGAVLSPRLFCVYIDDLFKLLRRKRTGCWINDMFIGIVGYADDLLLLSPTIDGLQDMIKTLLIY